MTDAERLLWQHLRGRQMLGQKFRRQHPIGPFIVDFVCLENGLIIEVDGGQHALEIEKDGQRTAWLKTEGYQVLRFWNHEVLKELTSVKERIAEFLIPPPP